MTNKKSKEETKILPKKDELQEIDDALLIPDPITEKLKQNLKPEQLKIVQEAVSTLQIQAGIREHPILKKVTSEHVTTLINNDEKASIRESDERKDIRKNYLIIFGSILFFIVFVCVFFTLTNNKDTLYKIIEIIVIFAGGLGTGYGVRSYIRKQ